MRLKQYVNSRYEWVITTSSYNSKLDVLSSKLHAQELNGFLLQKAKLSFL